MDKTVISRSEQLFIVEGCQDNCRQDGRTCDQFRQYLSVVGGSSSSDDDNDDTNNNMNDPIVLSNGSSRVLLPTGETHILVSVKAELVEPSLSKPDEGVVEVQVDMMNSTRRNEEMESTLVDLLVPHLVDLKALCIVPEYYAWRLHVDLMVLESEGGSLLDACSRGIHQALCRTRLPKISQIDNKDDTSSTTSTNKKNNKPALQVHSDLQSATSIPGVDSAPTVVTVSLLPATSSQHRTSTSKKAKPVLILDATKEEEACAYAQVHVVLDQPSGDRPPMICALHKAGDGSLPFSTLQDVTSFVVNGSSKNTTNVVVAEPHHHLLQGSFIW